MIKFCLVFLSLLWPLAAEEVRVEGGLSADGKFEIVVSDTAVSPDDPANHEFVLRDTASEKKLLRVSPAGYANSLKLEIDSEHLQHPNCSVLWNRSSTAFAFNLRDSKRSRSTLVFVLRNGVFEQVPHDDALPLITKELGISGVDRCYFQDPLRWEADTRLVLRISGDCVLPDMPRTEAGRWFEYEALFDPAHAKPLSIKQLVLKDHNG